MEYQSPAVIERGVLEILRKLNVLYPEQITELLPGSESGILKAIKRLEKQHQLYRNPYTGLIASSEYAYGLKEEGTICCVWVLADMMKKREIDSFFLVIKEEFPVRVIFTSKEEIYDILYVGTADVKLVNGLYRNIRHTEGRHIVAVEEKELMNQLQVPDVIGYCVVEREGGVFYYRRK